MAEKISNRSPKKHEDNKQDKLRVELDNEVSALSVKVTDYYFVADGKCFDKHFFIINIIAENYNFSVDRSYVDFVELDRLLRKKFPESNLGILPLEESRTVKKTLLKEAALSSERKRSTLGAGLLTTTRNSLAYTRESMMGGDPSFGSSPSFPIPEESREDIGSKRYLLDKYLQDLLEKHEIIGSDEMMVFLDEERRNIAFTDEPDEPLNVHDLLLINVPVNKCVVHRTEEYQYHVPRGHLILWRFSTQYYDIGFSVEMNGAVKVPYTRCSSHKTPVCGILEVSDPTICLLKWDNSYAKLRTKQLAWSVRVVSPEQFHTAKAQALDCQRERKRFEQQRYAVHRCANKVAAGLQHSGAVLLETSVLPDHAEEESLLVKKMESELRKYKEEVATLLADLKRTEGCIEELQAQCQAAEDMKQSIAGSWQFSSNQLVMAELEIEDCNRVIEQLSAEIEERDDELEHLDRDVGELERTVLLAEKARREQFGECTKELRAADREAIRREKKLRERQQEYDEIKAAIAQAATAKRSGEGDSFSSSAQQQQQYREERLCLLVEKLLGDVEKCGVEVERKNSVIRSIGEHIASTAAAAAAAASSDENVGFDG